MQLKPSEVVFFLDPTRSVPLFFAQTVAARHLDRALWIEWTHLHIVHCFSELLIHIFKFEFGVLPLENRNLVEDLIEQLKYDLVLLRHIDLIVVYDAQESEGGNAAQVALAFGLAQFQQKFKQPHDRL